MNSKNLNNKENKITKTILSIKNIMLADIIFFTCYTNTPELIPVVKKEHWSHEHKTREERTK